MTKEEINDDLINEYLNVKSKKTHLLSLNCVEVKEHIEVKLMGTDFIIFFTNLSHFKYIQKLRIIII